MQLCLMQVNVDANLPCLYESYKLCSQGKLLLYEHVVVSVVSTLLLCISSEML